MAAEPQDALAEALRRLDDDLNFDKLDGIIEAFKAVAFGSSGERQLAAWVAESVVADLQSFWDDRPIAPSSAEQVNAELRPALVRVAEALPAASETDLHAHAIELVATLLELQRSGTFD